MLYDTYTEAVNGKWEKIWIRRIIEPREALPLMINYAGSARWPAGTEVIRQNSNLFAIEYVCAGDAILVQDHRHYVIPKGTAYLLRMNADHAYRTGPKGILFKRYATIDGYDLENILRYLRLWDRDYVTPVEPGRILGLLKRCTALLSQSPSAGIDIELSAIAYRMLIELGRSTRTSYPDKVERAIGFMYENLHRQLSRREILDHVGTSAVHLNRLFDRYLHRSPMSCFIDLKMKWAASLLESTGMSVKEVAYRIGLDDQFHFSSLFKKHMGVSPKAYRGTSRNTGREFRPD